MITRRHIRMRQYNPETNSATPNDNFDILLPQADSTNIIRPGYTAVQEDFNLQYDRHIANGGLHIHPTVSTGDGFVLSVVAPGKLVNGYTLMLTIHVDLECEPRISFNGGEEYYIVTSGGDRIPGGQVAGCILLVSWSAVSKTWILLSSTYDYSDYTKVALPVESEYAYTAVVDDERLFVIPDFNKDADRLVINYGQTILRYNMDYKYVDDVPNAIELLEFGLSVGEIIVFNITKFNVIARKGMVKYDLKPYDFPVNITEDNVTEIVIPFDPEGAHSLTINYGQTILRNNLDYVFDDIKSKITLTKMTLNTGDVLVFSITRFEEGSPELHPNNWGTTGTYRYSLNVVHASYTSERDNVALVSVPNFDHRRDNVSVIRNNMLYIYDVDYTIDEVGNVILLKSVLNVGETIYFTILQGAMMDVPNFNVTSVIGSNGQHLVVPITYNVLTDYYTLMVRLNMDLLTAPTLKCIDGPAEPIVDSYGLPILGDNVPGSYLWLVYNKNLHVWYALNANAYDNNTPGVSISATGTGNFTGTLAGGAYGETVIAHNLGVTPTHVTITPNSPPDTGTHIGDIWCNYDDTNIYIGSSGASMSSFTWYALYDEDATSTLSEFDQQLTDIVDGFNGADYDTYNYAYTATTDDTTDIPLVSDYNDATDGVIVMIGQDVLKPEVDYIIQANTIMLLNIDFNTDDILQYTLVRVRD